MLHRLSPEAAGRFNSMTPVTFSRMPMPAEPAGLQSGKRCGKFPALHEAPAEREPQTKKKDPVRDPALSWLGYVDSNHGNGRFRVCCLTAWLYPKNMAGVRGFEPRKWQIQSLLPYRLAIPQKHGWGTWIRTTEMADSESAALPLGYTPMCLFILPQGASQNKHEFEKIRRQPHDTGCPPSNHDPPHIPYHIYPGSGQRFMASRNRSVANQ